MYNLTQKLTAEFIGTFALVFFGEGAVCVDMQLRTNATGGIGLLTIALAHGLAIAIIVEVAGSIALILGFHARWTAAILAIFTIATALAFHNKLSDQDQFIHFFKNIAMTGGLLQVVAFGAGRFSLDARRH